MGKLNGLLLEYLASHLVKVDYGNGLSLTDVKVTIDEPDMVISLSSKLSLIYNPTKVTAVGSDAFVMRFFSQLTASQVAADITNSVAIYRQGQASVGSSSGTGSSHSTPTVHYTTHENVITPTEQPAIDTTTVVIVAAAIIAIVLLWKE